MENKNEIFGKRLKKLRERTGTNQETVGKAIGISRARYSHYENNHVEPDIELIRKLADHFKVSTDYLLGRTNDITSPDNELEKIKNKIATEFPDIDLMFNDLESMTAEDLKEVYEYIKFKKSQKDNKE
ncbi:helix-turn-helix domain-containing protein [Halalkalibacter hemicellulosilyticus]|nr:helix-turn-helix transcriptional regulator [Halalkalibacter hemicellulosilyticus]